MHALTLIAFVGSVFSPYYAWARRRGDAEPSNHCALNVVLYSPRAARWSMTERGARQVERRATTLALGNSRLRWEGGVLHVDVDEFCAPLPRRLRGTLRLTPTAACERRFFLDEEGLHQWSPVAPRARVEVKFDQPALRWSGVGYMDSNFGAEPVEQGFESWTWSRAVLPEGSAVLYDVVPRVGSPRRLGLDFDARGAVQALEAPALVTLPRTRWGLARHTRADASGRTAEVHVVRTLEDAPFYSRSLLATRVRGQHATAIHESLDLDRFRAPWVQAMLPFRMPRRVL